MIFRDLNTNIEKPYHDGKWIYPDSIYENVEHKDLSVLKNIKTIDHDYLTRLER